MLQNGNVITVGEIVTQVQINQEDGEIIVQHKKQLAKNAKNRDILLIRMLATIQEGLVVSKSIW